MDLCLQILINAADHKLPEDKDAIRYVNGDIFKVHLASEIGVRVADSYTPKDLIGSKRLGFLFVIDCPEIDIEKANQILVEDSFNVDPKYTAEGWDEDLQEVIPPQQILDDVVSRNWYLDVKGLSAAQNLELFKVKFATISFMQFFTLCKDKLNPDKTLEDMGVTV